LLLKDEHHELQGDQKKYLKEVAVGNRRMIELVNALLNLSRLELGTVAVEPKEVKLSEVASSVTAELSHELKLRKQTIKIDIPSDIPQFKSDPQLLRIIIQNLMSNAIKYTPTQGHIELKAVFNKIPTILKSHKVEKNTITILVRDNGFGIPKPEVDKIFTKLYRATNIRTKNTDGTGLGLYMVKMLCGILKARIWFDSHEGKGSTFYINIPANAKIVKSGNKQLET
jgi:signal transduction histidine kinase